MHEETLVEIRPYAKVARGSSLLSDEAAPEHPIWGSDGVSVDDSGLTLINDSDKVVEL